MTQTLVNKFLLKKALSAENKNHQREIFLSIYFLAILHSGKTRNAIQIFIIFLLLFFCFIMNIK